MKLSVGKVAFPIEFDNGDKDTIYFNPSDPDLATRLMKAKNNINERLNNLNSEDFNLTAEGNVEFPGTSDGYDMMTKEQQQAVDERAKAITGILENTKKILCEEIDIALNGNVSSVAFKHCSPVAIVNGEYFIVQFMNALTPEIQKHIKASNEELEKKMSKHIAKYQKR